MYEVKSKSNETLKKKHIYSKYTKTKLILLFNVILLDSNAPVPAFHKFFNSVRKKFSFLVASVANFATRQFLERIVTADETWVHHYEPESKAQSVAWKRPISPVDKKFKSQLSAGKIMLTLFWDMEGEILVHFTPKGETVKSDIHAFRPMKEALRGRRF
jgi:hypothetical protein